MTSTPPHCFAVIIILIIRARHDIGKTYTSVEYGNIDIVGVLTFEMFNTIFFFRDEHSLIQPSKTPKVFLINKMSRNTMTKK